jgi:hypothetical protein
MATKKRKKHDKKSSVRRETPPVIRVRSTSPAAPPVGVPSSAAPGKTRPTARFHRASASPAQRRGADLVRYLRLHLRRPYGDRGVAAIAKLAQEVAHLANLELNARQAPEGGGQ